MMVRSRHHQHQGQRQQDREKMRLQKLQHRGTILNQQLQSRHQDRQQIELRVSQLHNLVANLTDRIDRDNARHQQLEQQLATLTLYCQTQENLATNLDRKIQDKQAYLLEVDTNLNTSKLELAQVQSAKVQVKDAEVDENSALLQQKIALELSTQSQQLAEIQLQLSTTELALQAKQVELAELAIEPILHGSEAQKYTNDKELDPLSDRLLQRELKIAQLELSSRQAELDNLEFKLHNRLQLINEIDLENSIQPFEPQPPIIDRQIEPIVVVKNWHDKFIDNPHLTVLKHIEKHGTITEAEASSKLGNARSVRQFANKLEEYAQDLPFSIRVESSPKGNRYLREDRN